MADENKRDDALTVEGVMRRMDFEAFRRQRSLLDVLEGLLSNSLSQQQRNDMEGISNLLDHLADAGHDSHGLPTLMQPTDAMYQASDFPQLQERLEVPDHLTPQGFDGPEQ